MDAITPYVGIVIFWLTCNGILAMLGVVAGITDYRGVCQSSWRRFEYIVPGFRLGCWLGGTRDKR